MTEERRLEMFPCVLRAAERVSVVIRSAAGIDRRGLHVTNIEALSCALERLAPGDSAISLVDGFSLPRCAVPHRAVIQGDGTSAAIAAASVIAKVTRDRYMREAAGRHPGWGFEEHVGYSTPEHRQAIEEIGISAAAPAFVPISRLSPKLGSCPGSTRCRDAPSSVLDVEFDAARAVEGDADGVEPDLGRSGELPALRHPGGGEAAYPELLAAVDREDGALRAERRSLPSGLDLDEDEGTTVEGDEVELAVAGAGVALDDLPARFGKPAGDEVLGDATGSLAGDGHSRGQGRSRH